MNRDDLLPIMLAMETYGGSFASNLAKAMLCADSENLARIVEAFPDMIKHYKGFVCACDNYVEDSAICYGDGTPKGQCVCGWKWDKHKGFDKN
jgi:hypothetical protein